MTHKEKAAGMLPTSATASKEQSNRSLSAAEKHRNTQHKAFATLQAKFALTGRELVQCPRASDGRINYIVKHRSESRHFTRMHDVHAHLNAIGDKQ